MTYPTPPGGTPTNRLAGATSPYLLQHAHNPVDWYPWGAEAFDLARSSGKPILLSIGYSACHWCHVMAHESFEDPATAAVMNELFVSIKVDREERPDIDRIYQLAHQLLTRRGGGWPLTMFLTHDDQRPSSAAPTSRPSRATECRVSLRCWRAWRSTTANTGRNCARSRKHWSRRWLPSTHRPVVLRPGLTTRRSSCCGDSWNSASIVNTAAGARHPSSRMPASSSGLLRDWQRTSRDASPDLNALFMATLTLKRMGDGGLCDQLGGGFCRYSVDGRWEIPHFEKMLYDNGALLSVFADAAAATGDPAFATVTRETATFLLRDMQGPAGGFYSSFDADSEGHEGRFYVWTPGQVAALLEPADAALFCARYGLVGPANFEGSWHLVATREIAELAASGEFSGNLAELTQRLDAARAMLFAARAQRVPPARDDKILASWNALAIRGLADAARALQDPQFAQAAARALEYLRRVHWHEGRLLAVSRDSQAQLPAYLDDHALLIDAILALATVHFDPSALAFAVQLADALLERFEDQEHGGFFFTARDHEALIHRSRSFSDDATPSGNAIAVQALQKLGWLLGEPRYLAAAERALRAALPQLAEAPLGLVHMANALEDHLQAHCFVILRGEQHVIEDWRRTLQRIWQPLVSVIAVPTGMPGLPAALAEKPPHGEAVAYLCRGSTCEAPLHGLETVQAACRPMVPVSWPSPPRSRSAASFPS